MSEIPKHIIAYLEQIGREKKAAQGQTMNLICEARIDGAMKLIELITPDKTQECIAIIEGVE